MYYLTYLVKYDTITLVLHKSIYGVFVAYAMIKEVHNENLF